MVFGSGDEDGDLSNIHVVCACGRNSKLNLSYLIYPVIRYTVVATGSNYIGGFISMIINLYNHRYKY